MEHVALITLNFWRTLPLNSLLADAIVPDRAAIMKGGIKVGGTKDVSASIVQCTSYKSQLFFSFSRIKKIAPLRPGKNLRNLIAEIYLAKIGQGIFSICTHLKSYVIHHILYVQGTIFSIVLLNIYVQVITFSLFTDCNFLLKKACHLESFTFFTTPSK